MPQFKNNYNKNIIKGLTKVNLFSIFVVNTINI